MLIACPIVMATNLVTLQNLASASHIVLVRTFQLQILTNFDTFGDCSQFGHSSFWSTPILEQTEGHMLVVAAATATNSEAVAVASMELVTPIYVYIKKGALGFFRLLFLQIFAQIFAVHIFSLFSPHIFLQIFSEAVAC